MTRPVFYTTRVDAVDANTTYIGTAQVGASESDSLWRVMKITVSGTVTSILYAGGNTDFDSTWSGRASHSYS